jgi:hypothetical protein
MITAHLVGDEKVLARVRAIPSAVSTGLVRTITKLGLDLQGRVQQDLASGQRLASRGGLSRFTVDLNLERSSDRIAATIFSGGEYAQPREYGLTSTIGVRASLWREKRSFRRTISEKVIILRAYNRKAALPERSFLRSALEEMGPAISGEVETAVRAALTDG